MCRLLLVPALLACAAPALAKTECATAERSTWQDPEQFQAKLVADGYRINTFKITEGNCYEIYGFDREGRKVEIYHDPVSGNAVKTESKD
nr:PepSY domain-containing protein [Pseudomonas sp. s4]